MGVVIGCMHAADDIMEGLVRQKEEFQKTFHC